MTQPALPGYDPSYIPQNTVGPYAPGGAQQNLAKPAEQWIDAADYQVTPGRFHDAKGHAPYDYDASRVEAKLAGLAPPEPEIVGELKVPNPSPDNPDAVINTGIGLTRSPVDGRLKPVALTPEAKEKYDNLVDKTTFSTPLDLDRARDGAFGPQHKNPEYKQKMAAFYSDRRLARLQSPTPYGTMHPDTVRAYCLRYANYLGLAFEEVPKYRDRMESIPSLTGRMMEPFVYIVYDRAAGTPDMPMYGPTRDLIATAKRLEDDYWTKRDADEWGQLQRDYFASLQVTMRPETPLDELSVAERLSRAGL
jgi:hypothetical protein